jgi:3-oxoacyl-[acyl-carrier protein] reductase
MLTIDLSGKVALVVGGSRGIGAGITARLAEAGADVTFTHTGNPARQEAVGALVQQIAAAGGQAQAVVADAGDARATESCVEEIVATRGRLDVLVHNAGQNLARPAEAATLEEWHHFLELNLTSAFLSVRAALPPMLAAGYGRIILIGSSAVYNGGGGAIDYAAAKAGLVGMMAYLTRTYTRRGILTNVIHPSVIETDLLAERYADEAARAALVAQIPVGRLGQPDDIAGLVAYLASSWGDYLCGQEILVDGGRTLFR